jgi:hypothetical protein
MSQFIEGKSIKPNPKTDRESSAYSDCRKIQSCGERLGEYAILHYFALLTLVGVYLPYRFCRAVPLSAPPVWSLSCVTRRMNDRVNFGVFAQMSRQERGVHNCGKCCGSGLFCSELRQFGMVNKVFKSLERKNLSSCGDEHFFHVFDPNSEAPAGNAGYDLVFLLAGWHFKGAEGTKVLDACYLVPGRTVVLRYFGFYYYLAGSEPGQNQVFIILAVKVGGRLIEQAPAFGISGCQVVLASSARSSERIV